MFKITFLNHGKVYELFCNKVRSSDLSYGFIEVAELVFEGDETLVIDPTEERMREEFADVETMHIPAHSVVRVEKVKKRGACVIRDTHSGEKVTQLPLDSPRRKR